jgi:hypothetical protein
MKYDLGEFIGLVRFDRKRQNDAPGSDRGYGIIVNAGGGEFYVGGGNFRITIIRGFGYDERALWRFFEPIAGPCIDYISVEEGYADESGSWVCTRKRNGDESDPGIDVCPGTAIRILLS